MFITVKYGANQVEIFNSNCKCIALLDNIKERCNIDNDLAEVDVCDLLGNVKRLSAVPHRYASDLLEERQCLVLLSVNKQDSETHFTPLLQDSNILTDSFYARLTTDPRAAARRTEKNSKSRGSSRGEVKLGGQGSITEGSSVKSGKSSKQSLSRSSSKHFNK